MARATPAYADLCRWDNLYAGWQKAAKGKRGRLRIPAFLFVQGLRGETEDRCRRLPTVPENLLWSVINCRFST